MHVTNLDHLYPSVSLTEHLKKNNVIVQQVIVGVLTTWEAKYGEVEKVAEKEKLLVDKEFVK